MISTPYKELRQKLGKPEDWQPDWAQRLEVRKVGNSTIYSAHPTEIRNTDLSELAALELAKWHVTIDSQRLSRIRINIWQ